MKKGILSKLILGLIVLSLLANCASKNSGIDAVTGSITKATLTQVSSFGSNPGSLAMYKYAPASMPSNAPLVVMMHGCTQSANDIADRLEWNKLADKYKFYVVYPQQSSSNNQNKCFNWFETGDIARGSGEALSIKQMVDNMKSSYSIDASRIFISGFSAGGYMTPVMMAAYPDVFAGGAVMSGGPYKCATSMTDAFTCMSPGVSKTADQWANLVKGAYSGYTGKYPRLVVFQGDSDYTVKSANMDELVKQWTAVHGADQTADFSETFRNSPHKQYKNSSGQVVVETYLLKGMGHATSVDVGSNADQGGTTGAYSEDRDIYSAYYAVKFWGLDNSDSQAPVVSITSPSNGASVSGNVTISANATDNVGVTKVEIYVAGALKQTLTASPYSYSWNSSQSNNGSNAILVKAYDAAGNVGSATITVTVSGGISDTTAPVITADKASGTYDSSVTVTLSSNETSTIYYTKDGSTPTESSLVYSGPLTFSANTTLKFFGKDTAGNKSAVETRTYTINTITYSETATGTLTTHYVAGRINATEYNDLGLGTNASGINPGKIKYGYTASVTLYKLKSTGKWVTSQSI